MFFLVFAFLLGMVLITTSCIMSHTSIHSSSGTLSDLVPWIYLSLPLYNHKGFDLGYMKGNQSWIFIGRADAEAETPVLWPPDAKNWLSGKDPDAGKDRRQEEKGTTEDEMAGWHHWIDGHEFEWTLGVDNGQGGLACCSLWGRKESEPSDWTELIWYL